MTQADILTMMKTDLGLNYDSTSTLGQQMDSNLNKYIMLAISEFKSEGITLEDENTTGYGTEDSMLIMMYARFLYNNRAEVLPVAMPRQIRFLLNNRLLKEKARTES